MEFLGKLILSLFLAVLLFYIAAFADIAGIVIIGMFLIIFCTILILERLDIIIRKLNEKK